MESITETGEEGNLPSDRHGYVHKRYARSADDFPSLAAGSGGKAEGQTVCRYEEEKHSYGSVGKSLDDLN